jgi:hypothetical protein
LLGLGAVLGYIAEHRIQNAHKFVNTGTLAAAVLVPLAILISTSSLPGTVANLFGGSHHSARTASMASWPAADEPAPRSNKTKWRLLHEQHP